MVVAELFVLVGVGRLLHDAGFDISTARILSLLVVIAAVGIAANALLSFAARWLAPWSVVQDEQAGRPWGRSAPKFKTGRAS
jgi:ABC-type nitrate/sulfonate/bicarbonate transport system permease component